MSVRVWTSAAVVQRLLAEDGIVSLSVAELGKIIGDADLAHDDEFVSHLLRKFKHRSPTVRHQTFAEWMKRRARLRRRR
jgi:hypothetical protein